MKKFILTMVTLFGMAVSSQAMSYEQARSQALFLADKMAYELNLTDEQYEACYEVNLDYFMGINSQADLYGDYWTRRNLDISYILLDWQYRMFLDAAYFYRPIYWSDGFWHFGIYARYPHRDFFYFGACPHFYTVYRGGHSWHHNGGHSWYHGRDFGHRGTQNHFRGMRDGFNKGDYGRGSYDKNHHGGNHGDRGNIRSQSSTRSTVGSRGHGDQNRGNSTVRRGNTFGGNGTSSQRSVTRERLSTGDRSVSRGSSVGNTSVQRSNSGITDVNRSSSSSNVGRSMNSQGMTRSNGTSMQRSSSAMGNSQVRSSASAPASRSFGSSVSRSSGSSMSRPSGSSMSRSSGGHSSMGGGSHGGGSHSGGSHGGGFGGGRR